MSNETYNPLDKLRLAESVAQALLARNAEALATIVGFQGAGIYALYYSGNFAPYAPISGTSFERPIYVGKAVPKGGRKGGWGLGLAPGTVLSSRLREHHRSLVECDNLDDEEFYIRYLVVDDVWIPLAESLLIEWFSPVWNTVLDGFGNHDPGAGRYSGQCPAWDSVHPGRSWASKLQPNARSRDELLQLVQRALAGDQSAALISPTEAVLSDDE